MSARIHPLTGESRNGKANGHPRPDVAAYLMGDGNGQQHTPHQAWRVKQSYDAARSGTDLDNHWAFADALDADSANNRGVRHTLIKRSRYEVGSNGYYAGIIATHCNMLVGVGPTLRMLTGSRKFNQLVEERFYEWAQSVQLRRKLWCMAHARTADGECFAPLLNNPILPGVQLDLLPMEAEQCQTPYLPDNDRFYIDGIKHDEFNNVQWYDVLPSHPGSGMAYLNLQPIRVSPRDMLHWFKLVRPASHRGTPECKSTLNVGAMSRRHREATVTAAETAASIAAMLESTLPPGSLLEPDPVAPFSSVEFARRMLMVAPMGWQARQMKGEHPNAEYADFHRLQISEQARPLSMPYNAAACDSSTYSFASGKLDTLGYRAALDVERQDCNDLVLDRLFAEWFREWTILDDRRDIPPKHQWDWPRHPIIDEVSHAKATQTKLATGEMTLRQVHSDNGQDYEDQLAIQAEDIFGEASDEAIMKCRQINALKNTPSHAVQYVAQLLGLQTQTESTGAPVNDDSQAV